MHDVQSLLAAEGFVASLRRSLDENGAPPLLSDVKIKITSRCNLRCRMCSYGFTRSETALSTAQWRRVLGEIAGLGARKVHFSGGEVFVRRDFLELVDTALENGLKVNLTTNATLIDRERARRLARSGVHGISVSLDGSNASLHDRIRGVPGAFKRTVTALRWLGRYGADARRPPKIRINFVVMRDNYRLLPDMLLLAAELGAIDLNPMPVDERGARKHRLSRRQIETYNREIAPRVQALRTELGFPAADERVHPFGTSPREIRYCRDGLYARGYFERHPCLAPWLHLFLAWDGNAYLCCMTNGRIEPLGNVASTSVADVFHGEAYRAVRAAFLRGEQPATCARCDLFLGENRALVAALGL